MPYNNTPVPPPKEVSGTVTLPLARVKKIISYDEDVNNCSNNAAFLMTIATEMFIQHITEKSYEMVKSDSRHRKALQYQHVANAVARIDNLEFLSDVVPRTTTYKKFVQERGKNFKPGDSVATSKAEAAGQMEQNGDPSSVKAREKILHPEDGSNHVDGDRDEMDVDDKTVNEEDEIQEQLAMEMANGS